MQIFMQSKNYSLQKYATKVKLFHTGPAQSSQGQLKASQEHKQN